MGLTTQEKELLKRVLVGKEFATAFITPSFKVAEGLVGKGLFTQHRNISPWHDTFKLTRDGRKLAKSL